MTHLMCWGGPAWVVVAVDVSKGFALLSLTDWIYRKGAINVKFTCGWDVLC